MKNRPEIISISNVGKRYTLHHEKPTLVENVIQRKHEHFWALHCVNLSIYKGEKIGIIGPNGSGKTTMLKIIAGITAPTTGHTSVTGKVVSLIDLEAGFHPDLTGEENIFLNGLLLGMKKNDVKKRLGDIIAFADIGKFIDSPLFTYSEGMKLRLGFSVAVHADPDILILDEGIAVGDEDFQKKSVMKIHEFFRMEKTVIICSHWLEFVQKNCTRIVWMEKGGIKKEGTTDIIRTYKQNIQRRS